IAWRMVRSTRCRARRRPGRAETSSRSTARSPPRLVRRGWRFAAGTARRGAPPLRGMRRTAATTSASRSAPAQARSPAAPCGGGGDGWGARLREEENPGIEERTDAAPDGSGHVFTPLALVDLGARSVLHDCRPTFVPLTLLATGCCTVSVKPGDDLQDALDRLPADGGELCMAAGVYPLDTPLQVKGRKRIVINGAGAATIIRATKTEAAVVIDSSNEIELHDLRVEGGSPGGAGDPHLNGAITASLVVGLTIADCSLACPGARGIRMQTCVTARAPAVDVRIERNSFEVGPWQTGILLLDVESALVAGNRLGLPPDVPDPAPGSTDELVTRMMRRLMGAAIAPPGPGVVEVAVPGAGQLTMTGGTEGAR